MTATTESVNLPFLRHLVVAVSAGSLVVSGTAAYLLLRRRRGRRLGAGRQHGQGGPHHGHGGRHSAAPSGS